MPVRKKSAAKAGKPGEFFSKQLKGEEALKFATAKRLYTLAREVFGIQPWKFMGDAEIFLLEDPISRETCYCVVMGALGEVFAIHAYIGPESYRFLSKLVAGEEVSAEEFYARNTGVQVEFVRAEELTPPDRELINAFGHPKGKGVASPKFRAFRAGFYPWYLTENEGVTLAACMDALVRLYEMMLSNPALTVWDEDGFYPFLRRVSDAKSKSRYEVEQRMVEPAPAAPVCCPTLDEARLRRIREKDYPVRGALEAGCFYSKMVVGKKDERKSCVRVGLVTDAGSGYLFRPELGYPEHGPGDILARAILNAIEEMSFLPNEIRVPDEELKSVLSPLAERMGIAVSVAQSLPMLQEAHRTMREKF